MKDYNARYIRSLKEVNSQYCEPSASANMMIQMRVIIFVSLSVLDQGRGRSSLNSVRMWMDHATVHSHRIQIMFTSLRQFDGDMSHYILCAQLIRFCFCTVYSLYRTRFHSCYFFCACADIPKFKFRVPGNINLWGSE